MFNYLQFTLPQESDRVDADMFFNVVRSLSQFLG